MEVHISKAAENVVDAVESMAADERSNACMLKALADALVAEVLTDDVAAADLLMTEEGLADALKELVDEVVTVAVLREDVDVLLLLTALTRTWHTDAVLTKVFAMSSWPEPTASHANNMLSMLAPLADDMFAL